MTIIASDSFELTPWQLDAVAAWEKGGERPYAGTFEIFTGGGKSLIAVECMRLASERSPGLRVAVVVPTEALARQWIDVIERHAGVPRDEIGLLGAGGKGYLRSHRVLVAVLNSAAKKLPEMARGVEPLMLVIDECHRAGAPSFSKVLDTAAEYRLGLSATPEREELDDDGEPLSFDEQLVGKRLGPVVYRFTLRDARTHEWLPDYELSHHGLTLHDDERTRYETASRRVDDLRDELRDLGADATRAYSLQRRGGDLGRAAKAYIAATSQRKDLLYHSRERGRIATKLITDALAVGPRRVLLFHERVDEAVAIYDQLSDRLAAGGIGVRIEHSRLPTADRQEALAAFRSGEASVLVSVKSLIEGIDVPDADVGISVASSSSVRQRVQALGRVLRRQFDLDAPVKQAEMHLLYVAETVDELIYGKEDWGDLTGEGANRYWLWGLDPAESPVEQPGPPRTPRPTEEQEWERLGGKPPESPELWLGVVVGQEYSVDTTGTVTNSSGVMIANSQGVDAMVSAVRGRPGGRFRVTPMHRMVLVSREGGGGFELLVAGALEEAFVAVAEESGAVEIAELEALNPADRYPGPSDKAGGTYKLRQKHGGVIERRSADRGSEFALTEGSGRPDLEENASRVLAAWRSALDRGINFFVNERGDAWYVAEGERRFLAHVPNGFVWPPDDGRNG